MADLDPALFYTGLVAQHYGALRAHTPDPAPYARFITSSGEPALELACGDGDPMLDLLAQGLRVEGLDSSPDMAERCRQRAAARGLDATVHVARMEAMDLGQTYRSIFLAGASFTLLADDDTAGRALERIASHLSDGGTVMVPLWIPGPDAMGRIGVATTAQDELGASISVTPLALERDDEGRTQRVTLRYERRTESVTEVVDRDWLIHWHTAEGFRALARDAGLEVVKELRPGGGAAVDGDDSTVVLLRLPE